MITFSTSLMCHLGPISIVRHDSFDLLVQWSCWRVGICSGQQTREERGRQVISSTDQYWQQSKSSKFYEKQYMCIHTRCLSIKVSTVQLWARMNLVCINLMMYYMSDPDGVGLTRIVMQKCIRPKAPMAAKQNFEAVSRTFAELLKHQTPDAADLPFGGKVVLLGGEQLFRVKRLLPFSQFLIAMTIHTWCIR